MQTQNIKISKSDNNEKGKFLYQSFIQRFFTLFILNPYWVHINFILNPYSVHINSILNPYFSLCSLVLLQYSKFLFTFINKLKFQFLKFIPQYASRGPPIPEVISKINSFKNFFNNFNDKNIMPKVTEQYLGVVHGKMGPSVFKEVNGIPYVAKAPKVNSDTSDPKVIARRNRFGLTMKLAHAINAILQLKYFWKNVVVPGHPKAKYPINKIVLLNYQNVSASDISDLTTLVPDKGFEAEASDVTMSNTQIEVTLEPIGVNTFINLAVDKYLYLACVLHLKTPVDTNAYPNRFFHLISDRQNINLINPLVFNLSLDSYDKQIFDEYTVKKAFMALVTTDVDDVPLHYSNTFLSV